MARSLEAGEDGLEALVQFHCAMATVLKRS